MAHRTLLLFTVVAAAVAALGADRLKFRAAKPRPVVNTYHGTTVTDPYQWLEDEAAPEVQKWRSHQDERTRRWLERATAATLIKERLAAWDRQTTPDHIRLVDTAAGLFAEVRQATTSGTSVVRLASVDDPAGAVTIAAPPTPAARLAWWQPSPSGRLLAVAWIERAGEDATLRFVDTATGSELPDRVPSTCRPAGTGGGCVAWTADEKAVHYTRASGDSHESGGGPVQVYRHVLGSNPGSDPLVLGADFPSQALVSLSATPDGAFTLAQVQDGYGGASSYHWQVEGGPWQPFAGPEDAITSATLGDDGMLYVISRQGAPLGRVLRLSLEHPDPDSGVELSPARQGSLCDLAVHDGRLYASEYAQGPSYLHQYSTNGASSRAVVLPEQTRIEAMVPRIDGTLLLRLSRDLDPPAWHVFNPSRSTLRRTALAVTAPVEFSDIRVERLQVPGRDGTLIPLTLYVPARANANAPAPVWLQVHGAEGLITTPGFSAARRLWFDAGGIFAIAHVRGGGELGAAWHHAARGNQKATTFSDLELCARYLVAKGRTTSAQLAIEGSGPGALAAGVALTRAPDLFRAVVARNGGYDLLRAEHTPQGRRWSGEFGSVQTPAGFQALKGWSPYHRVSPKINYPGVLLFTDPGAAGAASWHASKFAARLQASTASPHPILLRVANDAAPAEAETLAFLLTQLDMTAPGTRRR